MQLKLWQLSIISLIIALVGGTAIVSSTIWLVNHVVAELAEQQEQME